MEDLMDTIIVSVTTDNQIMGDYEVPVNIEVEKLLKILCKELGLSSSLYSRIMAANEKSILSGKQTLAEFQLMDGEIFKLIE